MSVTFCYGRVIVPLSEKDKALVGGEVSPLAIENIGRFYALAEVLTVPPEETIGKDYISFSTPSSGRTENGVMIHRGDASYSIRQLARVIAPAYRTRELSLARWLVMEYGYDALEIALDPRELKMRVDVALW